MLPKDRDRMIELCVFYDFIDEWLKDNESEIKYDTKRMGTIRENIKQMTIGYGKKEGRNALDVIFAEARKLNMVFMPKDEKIELPDSLELNILKGAVKKVTENCTACELCNRADYKYCEWFTLQNFSNKEPTNKKRRGCPFKKNLDDIFNTGDIDNIFDIKDL